MSHAVNPAEVGIEDVAGVRSRVSWGAIFAGAVIALALYLVTTLLGSAIGLSISDRVGTEALGTGAAVWAVFSTALALFAGGWVASQLTVGENKSESVIHGLIVWAAVLAMILWMVATGIRTGFNAMLGIAYTGTAVARDTSPGQWEDSARRAGVSQQSIDEWKQKAADAPAAARQAVENPTNRLLAAETATKAAWWTLLGTLISMATAVAGALVGSGPSFRLLAIGGAPRYRPTAIVRP